MSTKETLEREADSANEKLHEASDSMKSGARQAADEAQRAAQAYAEQGKTAAASSLNDFASAVRRASDELNERDQSLAATLVSQAATSLEEVASSISGSSVDDVMHSMQGFARRNPAALVVGAVLAGIALGRFARASGSRDHRHAAPAPAGYRPPPAYAGAPRGPVAPANPAPK